MTVKTGSNYPVNYMSAGLLAFLNRRPLCFLRPDEGDATLRLTSAPVVVIFRRTRQISESGAHGEFPLPAALRVSP